MNVKIDDNEKLKQPVMKYILLILTKMAEIFFLPVSPPFQLNLMEIIYYIN